jgi:hypothetical protein
MKRGRPPLDLPAEEKSHRLQQQRLEARRRYKEHQRHQRRAQIQAANVPVSAAQQAQQNELIQQMEQPDLAPPTISSIGLRIEGLAIAGVDDKDLATIIQQSEEEHQQLQHIDGFLNDGDIDDDDLVLDQSSEDGSELGEEEDEHLVLSGPSNNYTTLQPSAIASSDIDFRMPPIAQSQDLDSESEARHLNTQVSNNSSRSASFVAPIRRTSQHTVSSQSIHDRRPSGRSSAATSSKSGSIGGGSLYNYFSRSQTRGFPIQVSHQQPNLLASIASGSHHPATVVPSSRSVQEQIAPQDLTASDDLRNPIKQWLDVPANEERNSEEGFEQDDIFANEERNWEEEFEQDYVPANEERNSEESFEQDWSLPKEVSDLLEVPELGDYEAELPRASEQDEGGNEQDNGGYEQDDRGNEQDNGGYEQDDGGNEQDSGGYEQDDGGNEEDLGNNEEWQIPNDGVVAEDAASNQTEDDIIETMEDKFFEQLLGFHGCSDEKHQDDYYQHVTSVHGDHQGLAAVFPETQELQVLSRQKMVDLRFIQEIGQPAYPDLKELYEGLPRNGNGRKHVCLHSELTREVQPSISYDIDSFLGFASSLAVASQGIWYHPTPLMTRNIQTDIHLKVQVEFDDDNGRLRRQWLQIQHTPHCFLGQVEGAHDIFLYVLFPHLHNPNKSFKALSNNQLTRWTDKVIFPALYQQSASHITQHLPASYQHSVANSRAKNVEDRVRETASYRAQQQLAYHIQPERLDSIWTNILERVNEPGLQDFREPQIFFSAKQTKLQFKTSPAHPTVVHTIQNFNSYLARVMDMDMVYLDRLYVDLGKEICPPDSFLPDQRVYEDEEPQMYLWKTCCLKSYIQWLNDDSPSGKQEYHQVSLLRDASNMTSLTAITSPLRKMGLLYSQFYASVKEVVDASKSYPFSNEGLENLSLDPQIRKGAAAAAGVLPQSVEILVKAYQASKHRAHVAFTDSIQKSFGIREEHRMTWNLLQRLLARFQQLESHSDFLWESPSYVWPIRTEVYMQFLWHNANKFAAGFELIRATCQPDFVTWEQTRMMAMFLRCLRFSMSAQKLSRESALWWTKRVFVREQAEPKFWYGLGFRVSLRNYGYCWMQSLVNWKRLAFRHKVQDHLLFGNGLLVRQYRQRWRQVRNLKNDFVRVDECQRWLSHFKNYRTQREILFYMVHLCLRQFRRDVFAAVTKEIRQEYRNDALAGEIPLCADALEEVMAGGFPHLVSGNKLAYKDPSKLFDLLWGQDDGYERKHWKDKPFRVLYQRAKRIFELYYRGPKQAWVDVFRQNLVKYHWIYPYPDNLVWMQTTKTGKRMWWSLVSKTDDADDAEIAIGPWYDAWEWGKTSYHIGRPPDYPAILQYTKEDLEDYFERPPRNH